MNKSHLNNKPLVGVSACLLGQKVRFDSGHKLNKFIAHDLTDYLDYKKVCPEVEAGFPIPRPAMQLRLKDEKIRLVISHSPDQDMTHQLTDYSKKKIPQLSELDGYIFKKNSPSCGVFRVSVVTSNDGYKQRNGMGLFAESFCKNYPLIPVEEEGRLNDPGIRENFFERLYSFHRWRQIEDADNNVEGFIDFHSRHKFLLMSRGSHYYQELGRLVSGTSRKDLSSRRDIYIRRFTTVMAKQPHRGMQVNVLLHIMGYVKNQLSTSDKQELLAMFESYRTEKLPLITPVSMLKHYLRLYPDDYMLKQFYLQPYPEQLALRSFH